MLKLRKNKKGFSLVELIVVIAIMAVLAGVVGGTLFSQLNKQKDNAAASEAAGFAGSAKTAIQADKEYQTGKVVIKDIVDDLVSESENALVKATTDPSAALVKGAVVGKKAGSHSFAVYYKELPTLEEGATLNGEIWIVCDSARSGKAAFGKKITYSVKCVSGATTVESVSVVVADYEVPA